MGAGDGGDLEVHRADAPEARGKAVESLRSLGIEGENGDVCKVMNRVLELRIRPDLVPAGLATVDFGGPSRA